MPSSNSNSPTQANLKPKSFISEEERLRDTKIEKSERDEKLYKVKMKYIKMMLKQKSTEDEFDSSDLELDFEDYLFKKTKNPALRKRKKRRKKYQLDKDPEIPFLSTDAKLHVLSIIKKAKTKEMKILNKKRLLKTADQARRTSEIFKILYDSKRHTKDGQNAIRSMESTLQNIEREAFDWDNS